MFSLSFSLVSVYLSVCADWLRGEHQKDGFFNCTSMTKMKMCHSDSRIWYVVMTHLWHVNGTPPRHYRNCYYGWIMRYTYRAHWYYKSWFYIHICESSIFSTGTLELFFIKLSLISQLFRECPVRQFINMRIVALIDLFARFD